MTEVPEHLLKRGAARRAALTGDASAIAAASAPSESAAIEKVGESAPATTTTASDVPATLAGGAAPPQIPVAPYIEASLNRKKIPYWVTPVLAFLPVWAIIYGLTLDKPTAKEAGPLVQGSTVYASCASCHGAGGGGGGANPALNNGQLLSDWPDIADQVKWVILGTQGFKDAGIPTYGANKKPVGGSGAVMPAWGKTLTAAQLVGVIRHERTVFGGEKFDVKQYESIQTLIDKEFPEKSAEYKTLLAEWAKLPPDA